MKMDKELKFSAHMESQLKETEIEKHDLQAENEEMGQRIEHFENQISYINENGANIEFTISRQNQKLAPSFAPRDDANDGRKRLKFTRSNSPFMPQHGISSIDSFFTEFQGVHCYHQAVGQTLLIEKILKEDMHQK